MADPGGQGRVRESVVDYNGKLYLGAGGSDFVAQYDKEEAAPATGRANSGSTQVVGLMDGKLVIGGHFYAVGDQEETVAGGAPGDVDQKGDPILNPFGECKRRQGIAAYSFGATRPELAPCILGQPAGVGAAREGIRLHTAESSRGSAGWCRTPARLSPASP